jgi:predicted ATPase/class 3 adenylate cyclase
VDTIRSLPSGTITFLFTDIEGSTKLWEQHPEPMRVALAQHDTLLRAAIEGNAGQVFKTVGDQFCAAFAIARDALGAALAAQRAVHTEDWGAVRPLRVRMALHTGVAEHRDGDYFGAPLNRVARLLAAGHGGQILLSQATADQIRDTLTTADTLRDLGAHRLKDLQQPEQVFQLVHPELPAEFPPLRSLEAFAHNLPRQLTSFVGREREMAEVKGLLDTTALLTLTGTGGCGKTRLALQVAADLAEQFGDGVWLVELAALSDPELVPAAVASTLGVREEANRPVEATLQDYLRSRSALLVLDNCEHLLTACANLVESLLRTCRKLKILASSREGLAISGEQTYRVPSLALPDPQQPLPVERLHQFEAIRLFTDRAVLSQSSFTLTSANAAPVVEICRRLEGIPLAIELAAARVKALPVEQLAVRMDDFFRLLTGGSRTALPRQQTLRAAIEWSYDLLAERERMLFCRLSVFAGGWGLEAAEKICAGDGIEEWGVLNFLTSLVEKSLVTYEERAAEGRYRLLETVRQYGRDRLLETGEAEIVRDRHSAYFLRLTEQDAPGYPGQASIEWLERVESEHDNLRAALAWRLSGADSAEDGLRLVVSIWIFWFVRGHLTEGHQWVQKALEKSHSAPPRLRARALLAAGFLAWYRGEYTVAQQVCQESLALWREEGDRQGMAFALALSGIAAQNSGSFARAVAWSEECLALARGGSTKWPEQLALYTLGGVAMREGDLDRASLLLHEGLRLARELEERVGIAYGLWQLGDLCELQGHYEQARSCYVESLIRFQEVGERRGIAHALEGLANLAVVEARPKHAAGLYGAAQVLREASGAPLEPVIQRDQATRLGLVRAAMGEKAFAAAWTAGRAMTLEQATRCALEQPEADPCPQ